MLRPGARTVFVFAGEIDEDKLATLEVQISVEGESATRPVMLDKEAQAETSAHVLRLRVAEALACLGTAARGPVGTATSASFEELHEEVISALAVAQGSAREGLLAALERDLGEALACVSGRASRESLGVLLCFAQEHLTMRSASSASRTRTTYASSAQVALRLRLLHEQAKRHPIEEAP